MVLSDICRCTHIPPLQVQLYQAKDQADKFDGSYQSLITGLGGVEEAQEKQEPIHSEVEVVKQQLEAHKVGYMFVLLLFPYW